MVTVWYSISIRSIAFLFLLLVLTTPNSLILLISCATIITSTFYFRAGIVIFDSRCISIASHYLLFAFLMILSGLLALPCRCWSRFLTDYAQRKAWVTVGYIQIFKICLFQKILCWGAEGADAFCLKKISFWIWRVVIFLFNSITTG